MEEPFLEKRNGGALAATSLQWATSHPNCTAFSLQNPWAGFADGNPSSTATVNGADAGKNVFEWKGDSGPVRGRLYSKDGIQAWYPASGCRYFTSGAFYNVGVAGYPWSSSAAGTPYGFCLRFDSSAVFPANTATRAYGFPVRCVQE